MVARTHPVAGSTRVFMLVGDPISHAKAPALFNADLAERDVDAVLIPLEISSEHLTPAFRTLSTATNVDGLLVTMPHKASVTKLSDRVGDEALSIGAANAVRFDAQGGSFCEMFDGLGLVAALDRSNVRLAGMKTLVVGSGGAGSAIAFALAGRGIARLALSNRTLATAEDLRDRIVRRYPTVDVDIGEPKAAGYDVVINATRIGMAPDDATPIDLDQAADCTVADIVTGDERSSLLRLADAQGLKTVDGRDMLRGQMRAIFEFWGV